MNHLHIPDASRTESAPVALDVPQSLLSAVLLALAPLALIVALSYPVLAAVVLATALLTWVADRALRRGRGGRRTTTTTPTTETTSTQ